MVRLELNDWYTDRNGLYISLLNFYVSINFNPIYEDIIYEVLIVDDESKKLFLTFDSLITATSFVEQVVNNCDNIFEIKEVYNEYLKQKKLTLS